MTLKVLEHVTMGSSCDHTGSKLSHDLSCDQVPDLAPSQSDNKSGDKECKHALTSAKKTFPYMDIYACTWDKRCHRFGVSYMVSQQS
jgi:hypothetical protein